MCVSHLQDSGDDYRNQQATVLLFNLLKLTESELNTRWEVGQVINSSRLFACYTGFTLSFYDKLTHDDDIQAHFHFCPVHR